MKLLLSRVMLNGRAGSGKDTIADYLVKNYNFRKVSFADPIYKLAREFFGMTTKDRKLLQDIGQSWRAIDPDVWVKYAFKSIKPEEKIVIPDVRNVNEYMTGIKFGFVPIRITTDLDKRVYRLQQRDGVKQDLALLENGAETGADNLEYIEITNNGTFDDLFRQIDDIIWHSEKYWPR